MFSQRKFLSNLPLCYNCQSMYKFTAKEKHNMQSVHAYSPCQWEKGTQGPQSHTALDSGLGTIYICWYRGIRPLIMGWWWWWMRWWMWARKWSLWVGVLSHSVVSNSATPWTVAHQAPLSKGFSRQEQWSGLQFPSPGGLPDPRMEPGSPTLQAVSLPSESPSGGSISC